MRIHFLLQLNWNRQSNANHTKHLSFNTFNTFKYLNVLVYSFVSLIVACRVVCSVFFNGFTGFLSLKQVSKFFWGVPGLPCD